VIGEDAHGIAAQTEKDSMAKADQTADAKRDVEAHGRQRKDGHAGGERDGEGLIHRQRPERDTGQPRENRKRYEAFGDHARAPKRPEGRQIRTRLMTM
jgi:hypothetical protein